ncbi:ParB/RepB/Spo0J family partition protein [Brevundimonas aurantiaca]|uniref:ParB/RepB/Spo0J family partition protein n=1 Tax=Brevundimonas aurantiaca TaxID=74316 RepID=UPI002FDE2AE3
MAAQDIIRPAEKAAGRTAVDPSTAAEAALGRAVSFPTSAGEVEVPPHLIRDPLDARPLDAAHIANLAVSMSEVGLENAVSVRLLKASERGEDGCVYLRTRGGHRLAAARSLKWRTVRVKIRDERAEIAKLAEIDENLLRRDYTPLERAQAFAERLEAWAAAHPDRVEKVDGQARAKRGRPGKSAKIADFLDGRPPLMGFASETASQAGLSLRTVEQALTMFRGIPASQQARLHGTWIAKNDATLRQLAGIGQAEEQAKVIDLLLEGRTKSVPEARALAAGHSPAPKTPSDTVQRDFERNWKAATPSQRDALLHWLAGQSLPKGWTILQQGEG